MSKITYTEQGMMIDGKLYGIDTINLKVNQKRIKNQKLAILTIEWEGYRRGFEGICERLVAPLDTLKEIYDLMMGQQVYFGEIAGKHSEVYFTVEKEHITIDTSPTEVTAFLKEFPNGHDYDHSALQTVYYDYSEEDGDYEAHEIAAYKTLGGLI